jgi:sterol desaturase/sphingolipid hydroxylase (fatty acid hydroxylase superfamily)
MASGAAAIETASRWPKWLLFVAYGAMLGMVPVSYWIGEAVGPFASQQSALVKEHLASGTLLTCPFTALHIGVWVVLVVLVQPLVLVGGLMLVERAFGFRGDGNWRLAWLVRAFYFALVYLIGLLYFRWFEFTPDPLLAPTFADQPAPLRIGGTIAVVIVSLLLSDLLQYWLHRAFHRYPALWRLHSVHHSPRRLSVLYNIVHPAEAWIAIILNLLIVKSLIVVNPADVWLLVALMGLQNHFVHMNVPIHFGRFRAVLVDNRFHFLHHSRADEDRDCNFAAWFPVLDRLFGTYRSPRTDELCETGVKDRLPPATLQDYFLARLPPERPTGSP